MKSFEYGDKVFFFFRESAVEYINCGKVIITNVTQIYVNGHPYDWTVVLSLKYCPKNRQEFLIIPQIHSYR